MLPEGQLQLNLDENAIAERVNSILKDEYDLHTTFADYPEANEAVKSAVNKYNNKRPHASCNYMVPIDAHQNTGEMKRWYPKKWQKSADHASDSAFKIKAVYKTRNTNQSERSIQVLQLNLFQQTGILKHQQYKSAIKSMFVFSSSK